MSFTPFQTSDRVVNTRMNQFGEEITAQITKFSTYDLYLKAGNLMNTQKPTGAGTLVNFDNVTNVSQLAYTFNYAIPEKLIISKDNRYNLVMPFRSLDSNRAFIFRYVYKHEGVTIFDITRNAISSGTENYTEEFQAINQLTTDIVAEANTTVTLQIYVRTVTGTAGQISLLVNDLNTLGRLSRNEASVIDGLTRDDIIDNLLSTDPLKVLSANQGNVLSSAIGQIGSDLATHKADYAKEPTVFNLTALEGHQTSSPCTYQKKNGFVFIKGEIANSTDTDIPVNTVIIPLSNLPIGFRPSVNISICATGSNSGELTPTNTAGGLLTDEGTIILKNTYSAARRIAFSATYYVGGGTV